jgi:hypothetical protein
MGPLPIWPKGYRAFHAAWHSTHVAWCAADIAAYLVVQLQQVVQGSAAFN